MMPIRVLALAVLLTVMGTAHSQTKPEGMLTPEQCRADITFAFTTMEDVHPNLYAWTPEKTIAAERSALEKSLVTPLTRQEFWLRLAPLVARLRDGHTWLSYPENIWTAYRDSGVGLFPIDTQIADGRMFVKTNYTGSHTLDPGTEITSINGVRVRDVLNRLLPFASEERLPARWNAVAASLRAYLYLNLSMTAPFTLEAVSPGGKPTRTTSAGVPWKSIAAARAAQVTSQSGASYFRYRFLREDQIGLIDYDLCTDLPKFEAFLKETFTQIQKDRPVALIIDVRRNPGGVGGLNETLCEYITDKPYRIFGKGDLKISGSVKRLLGREAFIQRLGEEAWNAPDGSLISGVVSLSTPDPNPLRYHGPIYCLIGPGTFSNGMAFASAIKDCKLGTLVGEETGGVGSAYGDFVTFTLPNSRLELHISLKHIYRPSGVDDGRGILPDFEVKQTPEDSAKGRDTVLEYTKRLIHTASKQ